MQRFIYILSLLILTVSFRPGLAQQELGLHFMPRTFQTQFTNSAFMQEKLINISLPSIYAQGMHNGFGLGHLLQRSPSGDSLILDVEGVLDRMKDENMVRTNAHADLLAVSVKVGPLQLSMSTGTRASGYLNYPKALPELAWYGNAAKLDETLNLGPDFQFFAYHEITAGGAVKLGKIQLGTRLKYLIGLANFSSAGHLATLRTNSEIYQLQLQVNYELQTSVFDLGNIDEINPSFEPVPFTKNHGFAADLGVVYEVNDRLKLSASIIDLGFINWNDQSASYKAEGDVSFEGLDVAAFFLDDSFDTGAFIDSLTSGISLTKSDAEFKTGLPARIYLSGTFAPIKSLRLGALFYNEFYRGKAYPSLAISASKDLGKIFTGGITYSVRNRRLDNLGVNLLLKPGPVVFFIVTDQLNTLILPNKAQQVNLRLGTNITF